MSEEASLKTFEDMEKAEAEKWFKIMLEKIAGYKKGSWRQWGYKFVNSRS